MRFLIFGIVAFLVLSCSDEKVSEVRPLEFFSLAEYVDDYLAMEDSLLSVSKSITVDGIDETKKIDQYDLRRDVEGFRALNIDKPALWDKYSVDTITEGQNQVIYYTSLDETLLVQSMQIVLDVDGEPKTINIKKSTSTFLADVQTEYKWTPPEGYIIIRDEDRLFADPTHHEIEVRKE